MNKKLLTVLFLGVLMGALDIAIIGPVLPALRETFAVNGRTISWVFNIYILANLISTPLMSKLSDLYGRRWIYIMDLFLFAMGSLVIITTNSFELFLLGRAIQGFGAGGIFPVASAVIGDKVPKEKQGTALGLIGAVFGLAFILGPVIGGIFLQWHWKWIFAINLPIALLIMILAYKVLPSQRNTDKIKFDWQGMLLMISSLGTFTYGITQIDSTHFFDSLIQPAVWGYFLVSFIALIGFYLRQTKITYPILNTKLLSSRQLRLVYLLALGAGVGEVGAMFIPALAKISYNLSNHDASFMLMPMVIALFIGAPLAGKAIDKTGPKTVIITGTFILAIGQFMIAYFPADKLYFYTGEVLLGLGLSALLGAPLRYIMNHETSDDDRASGQSVLSIFTSVGQMTSAALVGALIASLGGELLGYKNAFIGLGIIAVLTMFVAMAIKGYPKANNPKS
jgi:EmrB/QacA subfamily drug resistance transporter